MGGIFFFFSLFFLFLPFVYFSVCWNFMHINFDSAKIIMSSIISVLVFFFFFFFFGLCHHFNMKREGERVGLFS